MEWQVCALEYSTRLKELRVKQESLWWWVVRKNDQYTILVSVDEFDSYSKYGAEDYYDVYSAFTCSELGEILPLSLFLPNCMPSLSINKHSKQWSVNYLYNQGNSPDLNIKHNRDMIWQREISDTFANAMAKMLIYLLENKLTPPPEK